MEWSELWNNVLLVVDVPLKEKQTTEYRWKEVLCQKTVTISIRCTKRKCALHTSNIGFTILYEIALTKGKTKLKRTKSRELTPQKTVPLHSMHMVLITFMHCFVHSAYNMKCGMVSTKSKQYFIIFRSHHFSGCHHTILCIIYISFETKQNQKYARFASISFRCDTARLTIDSVLQRTGK